MHMARQPKPSSIRVLFCGLAAGCLMVTLLASRSLLGTSAAVAQQIKQPRRGLQGSLEDHDSSGNPVLPIPTIEFVAESSPQAPTPLPTWSSVKSLHHSRIRREDPRPRGKGMPSYQYYNVYENVKIDWTGNDEVGVIFFHQANETIPEQRRIQPKAYRPDRGQTTVSTHYKAVANADDSPLRSCSLWVNQPAIVFHAPYPDNIFHFMNDGYLAVMQTVVDSDFVPPAHVTRIVNGTAAADQCTVQTLAPAEVELVAIRADAYHQPWSHLLDHISSAQSTLRQRRGHCFRKLIVGSNMLLDAFEQGFDDETLALRKAALQTAQRFLMSSALTHKLQYLPPQLDAAQVAAAGCARIGDIRRGQSAGWNTTTDGWRSGQALPQVTLASRTGPRVTRALLNEGDLVRFVEANWEVAVVPTTFNMSLFDTVDLMQRTDVFLGMHGAGMTNIYFMPEATSVVQLLPYGWNTTKPGGNSSVVRGGLYKKMADIQNIVHHYWINGDAKNAFFHQKYFNGGNKSEDFLFHPNDTLERPTDDLPHPGWIYQDTFVVLSSLEPILAEAFAAAGVKRRVPALPFEPTFQPPAVTKAAPSNKAAAAVVKAAEPKAPTKKAPASMSKSAPAAKKEAPAKKPQEQSKAPAPEPDMPWTGIVCHGKFCK